MKNRYSFSEFISTTIAFLCTKLFYKDARLIRLPFYFRGVTSLQLGEGLTTGYSCRFDLPGTSIKTLVIGKNCEMGDNVHIVAHKSVTIGENCLIASKVFISDTSHGDYNDKNASSPDLPPKLRELAYHEVSIGNNVWIGENVCILPGVNIGDGCIIGANSVVTRNIEDNTIAVGAPAKVIKKFCFEKNRWDRV